MQKILMERVDHHDTNDLLEVARAEDTRDDAASTRRDENIRALFSSLSKSFRECVRGHAGRVWGGCVVREGIAGAVPVAVAGDGTVLVSCVGPVLEVVLQWRFARLEEDGRVVDAVGLGDVSDAGEMHGVLVAVYKNAFTIHLECCVAATHTESSSHQDDDDDEDDGKNRSDGNSEPFLQCAARLGSASKTFLLFVLAVCDDTIGQNAPNSHDESPDNTCDTDPAFLEPDARNGQDEDHVDS